MKIGLLGYYGQQNTGDDLILRVMLEYINRYNTNTNITVFGIKNNIKDIITMPISIKPRSVWTIFKDTWVEDIMIVGGGGLFPHGDTPRLLFFIMLNIIMKIRRKKIGYIGIGIGKGNFQHALNRCLLKTIICTADTFVTRQKEPFVQYWHNWKYKNRLSMGADVVFSPAALPNFASTKTPNLVIIALANIFDDAPKMDALTMEEKFLNEVCIFLQEILAKDYVINLIAFSNGQDQAFNDRIANKLQNKRLNSIPYQRDPYVTYREITKAQYCVAMRFHAIILAIQAGIPVMSISYSDKNEDLMLRLKLEEYSVRFGISNKQYFNNKIQISAQSLIKIFFSMVKNESYLCKHIDKKKKILQKISDINCRELHKLFTTMT